MELLSREAAQGSVDHGVDAATVWLSPSRRVRGARDEIPPQNQGSSRTGGHPSQTRWKRPENGERLLENRERPGRVSPGFCATMARLAVPPAARATRPRNGEGPLSCSQASTLGYLTAGAYTRRAKLMCSDKMLTNS